MHKWILIRVHAPGLAVSPDESLRGGPQSEMAPSVFRGGFKEIGGSGPFEVNWPWLCPADSERPDCRSRQTEAAWGLRADLDECRMEQKKTPVLLLHDRCFFYYYFTIYTLQTSFNSSFLSSAGDSCRPELGLNVVVTMVTTGRRAWTLSPCGLMLVIGWSVSLSQRQNVSLADCSRKEHPVVSYQGKFFLFPH